MKTTNTLAHMLVNAQKCLVAVHSHPVANKERADFQLEAAYHVVHTLVEQLPTEEPYGFVLNGEFHDMSEDDDDHYLGI